jgi:DNA-binding GntR family transcriptional regulator
VPISPDDPRSPYLQIADDLRAAIRRGDLAPGAQISSTNTLMDEYGVARNTVRSALRVLSEEGLLVARQGSGVFVRSSLPAEVDSGTTDSQLDAVLQQLAELATDVRRLGDRVSELEAEVRNRPAGR